MPSSGGARVVIAMKWVARYEVEFLRGLRELLHEQGVRLDVVCGRPQGADATRGDAICPGWAIYRANRVLHIGPLEAIWQPCLDVIKGSDLVVLEQASRLLLNAYLLARPHRPRVALWGHGANLDRGSRHPAGEFLKRLISTRADWWFAYTEGSKRRVIELGYPADRITVVQNAIPTERLRRELDDLSSEQVAAFKLEHDVSDRSPVALFLGSLYRGKRLDYVVAAADAAHRMDSSFRLLVAGDGPERGLVEALAASRPYMRVVGRADGETKALMLAISTAMVIPYAAGLAVLDAFAAGLPVVSMANGNHGPESEYVSNRVNGLVLPPGTPPDGFASAVLAASRSERLAEGAYESGSRYTAAEMVDRFAAGVLQALDMPTHRTGSTSTDTSG